MITPQEVQVWYILPAVRRNIAIELKKQGIKHADYLRSTEDVEFIEGELPKLLDHRPDDPIGGITATQIKLLHDQVKDIGIGQNHVAVAEHIHQGFTALTVHIQCHNII